MEFTNMIIPEVINGFNVYDIDGNVQVGITDEMSMAELASRVAIPLPRKSLSGFCTSRSSSLQIQ